MDDSLGWRKKIKQVDEIYEKAKNRLKDYEDLLEKESADLEKQASKLAEEIKALTGEEPTRIG